MQTKKLTQAYLNGKPLWKCSHSELTTYAKNNNLTLAPGLKTYQVASLVKKHLEANGGGSKPVEKIKDDINGKLAKLKSAAKVASKAARGMESIKIWNLHKQGLTPEQIEKELGHAAWYNKKTIERYQGNANLQARAEAIADAKK